MAKVHVITTMAVCFSNWWLLQSDVDKENEALLHYHLCLNLIFFPYHGKEKE